MSLKANYISLANCIFGLLLALCMPVFSQSIQDQWLSCKADSDALAFEPLCTKGTQLKWSGEVQNGKAQGQGIMEKFHDGRLISTYFGSYVEGIAQGQGRLLLSDNTVYEGEFSKGQPSGIMEIRFFNGEKYRGRVINFSMHGQGEYEYLDSSRFEGLMVNDKPYTGKYVHKTGQVKFIEKTAPVKKASSTGLFDFSLIGKPVISYLDEMGRIVKSKNAASLRQVVFDSSLLPVTEAEFMYPNRLKKAVERYLYLDLEDPLQTYRDGTFVTYHPNGRMMSEGSYRRNRLHGIMKEYDEQGNLIRHSVFSIGTPDGDFVEYYPDGEVKSYAYFEMGELVEEKFLELDKAGRQSLVRKENFARHKDLWEHSSDLSGSEVLDTGSLMVKVRQNGSLFRSNMMEVDPKSDYCISAWVRKVKGEDIFPYGLVFEFSDWDNYMEFLISDNGSFIVYGKRDGQDMFLTDWQQTDFVKPPGESNHLEVKKTGNSLNYFINGEQVGATRFKGSTGNQVGILVGGKGEYEFNRLIVREYLPAAEMMGKRNAPFLVKAE